MGRFCSRCVYSTTEVRCVLRDVVCCGYGVLRDVVCCGYGVLRDVVCCGA